MKPLHYSLTRFFNETTPRFPCKVAGRFFSKSEREFELRSQGRILTCGRTREQTLQMRPLLQGDWTLAEIEKTKRGFQLRQWKKLSNGSPEILPVRTMKEWGEFLSSVRGFFSDALQVETPSLVESPGTEPHLLPFETKHLFPDGLSRRKFLPTSPEVHLKKLLCCGWTDIFEIKKCFRNGELSDTHSPEFYMLEWYRAFFTLEELAEELFSLIQRLSRLPLFKGRLQPLETVTVRELFHKHLNFKLTPDTGVNALNRLIEGHLPFSAENCDSWEDRFHTLFLNKIEPNFHRETPLIVKDYPPQLRGFSRLNGKGWADRFEFYWRGMELANAFFEVIDPGEQKQLFQSHLKQRADSVPMDRDLLSLMEKNGMPPCSGIALGLDRLFSALCREKRLLRLCKTF